MHAAHYSSLLPEIFRHKTTRVRVPQPKAVLLDFHGTISERHWEDKVIFPYVKQAVGGYLRENWDQDSVRKCLPALRNESFEQRFRNKFDDAPVINEPVDGEEELVEPGELARQMGDFIVWQMDTKKETSETQVIERLVWQDGLRRKKILTPIFDDVIPYLRDWHDRRGCAIHVISSLEQETLKLLFENTNRGNMNQYVGGYVSTKSGDKLVSNVYKRYYEGVRINARSPRSPEGHSRQSAANHSRTSSGQTSKSNSPVSNPMNDRTEELSPERQDQLPSGGKSPRASPPFEHIIKPILFLTDSGQEARAASLVDDGQAFECILVNRPGNRRIRTYYLSQFQYIERFDDIEFVT